MRLVAVASAAVATAAASTAVAAPAATATAAATIAAATTAAAAATEPPRPPPPPLKPPLRSSRGRASVDGQRPAIVLLAVQRRDRGIRLGVVGELHEPETLAPTRLAIAHDLGRSHLAMLPEQLLEFRAVHAISQIPNVQPFTHA